MNAPAGTAALAAPVMDMLPIADITPSKTHIQALRRQRFDKKVLDELADSIRQVGVLQPILVRPTGPKVAEIVAGERRWIAAKLAGLSEIPASVRDLTDEQVLEVQLIENLQREGLHELEEAEGYEELMKLKKISADAVADMVGRSRSYVFKRTKLLALCPEARKAFYAGELDASIALLIARIPHHDLQRQAMKDLEDQRSYGDVTNYKEAQQFFHEHYMLQLKAAPFDIKDANLVPKAGSCEACPKRTGNQKDLFGDVKSGDVCTDTKCFDAKKQAHSDALRKAAEAKGETIITGAEAKKIKPNEHSSIGGGYVSLDEEQYLGNSKWGVPRKVLGKSAPETVLLEDPHTGELTPIAKKADVEKALKAKGFKPNSMSSSGGSGSDSYKAAERRARVETIGRMKILNAIREASVGRKPDEEDVRLIAAELVDRAGFDTLKAIADARNLAAGIKKPKGHDYAYALEKQLPKLKIEDVWLLMLDAALAGEVRSHAHYGNTPTQLLATAKRLKVNAAKILADNKAEFAEKKKKAKPAAKKKGSKG